MKIYEFDYGYTDLFAVFDGDHMMAVEPEADITRCKPIVAIPPIWPADLLIEGEDGTPQIITRHEKDPKTGARVSKILSDEEFLCDAGLL